MLEESEDERLEESEDEWQEESEDERQEESKDERQDALVDEMHVSKEELSMIEKDKTWELVNWPLNRKIIGVRWIFRKKLRVHNI